jgi:ferredoxin, 2Fe-2S
MTTITIRFTGPAPHAAETRLECETGQSLMQAAVAANLRGIEADCGGMMTCATCHVHVRGPHAALLPAPTQEELAMLEFTAAPRDEASRLGCQIQLTDALNGLLVELPETQH